ncbi:MAG: nucleotidyl transferase AbiEii/AbiGii toxin family protein [Flavobacteriales bacterium]|nr:nucleotidyl transferase AbiEii/AbiGii toxin family protein [Flavobacteriales bacterium]
MLKNTHINREATKKVARALGELNEKVVYVGGAVVSLYIDDPAADDVRPTKDIDISLEIASIGELEKLRTLLNEKGFIQSHEDEVICRFNFEGIKVDVMATQALGWAPANPWFAPGFEHRVKFQLDEVQISILPLAYFLATKFTAFYSRGSSDPRASHDFEDIVYLLNHTSNLKDQILESGKNAQDYLKKSFRDILQDDRKQEAILGNLYFEDQAARMEKIIDVLKGFEDDF